MSERAAASGATFWGDVDDSEALQHYRTLVNTVEDGIYQLDAEGRFVAINDVIVDATGYDREELLGAHVSLVLAESDVARVERDIRRRLRAEGAVDREDPFDVSVETADGRSLFCELRYSLLATDGEFRGTVGVVRDVTDRVERRARLASAVGSYESIAGVLDEADVGVFVLDDEFEVAWINEATERYFGIDRDEVVGRDKRQLIEESIRERVVDPETFTETVHATYDDNREVERFECQIAPTDGRPQRWLEHRSKPIETGAYAGGRVELYYDITDQRRRAVQLKQLNEAVREWLEGTSREAVAEKACRHLFRIFDLEINGIFLHDSTSQELRPVAWSDPVEDLFDRLPTFAAGEGIAWRAFESGEVLAFDDVRGEPDVYNPDTPIRSEIVLPIGDHGVVVVGSEERGAFDDGDLTIAKLVASNLEATFDRIRREHHLERERTQTEKLLQTAPIAIYVEDAAGDLVLANDRARDVLGASTSGDGDGRELVDWGTPGTTDGSPDGGDGLLARVRATGDPVFDEEVAIERSTGERAWFSVNAVPLYGSDGSIERVVSTGEDVTTLKEHERRLERRTTELETELSDVFGRVSDAFYALDEEWRFTHLNESAEEALGRSGDAILGRTIWEVFPEMVDTRLSDRFREAMETQESVSFEFYAERFGIWTDVHAYPSPTGLSVYFQDVTERKEYQHRLTASNERLEQFAYAASHDLQEPLRMVSSYLLLLQRRYGDELDEDGTEFIEYAVDGADRMRKMIDALLEYSRIETRGDPFESVDLDAVLADVRKDLEIRIAEREATISAGSLPRVDGDESQLRQLLQNLLDNAIEYSGDEPPRVHVSAERDGPRWVISVRDEGIGIETGETDRIFEIFQRLHTRDEHPGAGIGLALCKRIVERHGGEIWVDSEPGEGASFSFSLPRSSS